MKHFVKDSYFQVVTDVANTWLLLKGIPDFKTVVGVELFTRYVKGAGGYLLLLSLLARVMN